MRMIMDIPAVASCAAEKCAFNTDHKCHAKAITIGNSGNPACDTYLAASKYIRDTTRIGGVGACKSIDCKNNEEFDCKASEIRVGMIADGGVTCSSYEKRKNH